MKLYIPDLGDKLLLSKPWTVSLDHERRNKSVTDIFHKETYALRVKLEREAREEMSQRWPAGLLSYPEGDTPEQARTRAEYKAYRRERIAAYEAELAKHPMTVTIPKGCSLIVDRIYIRKGAEGFSSVTFKWNQAGKVLRFWVPLTQANQLEFSHITPRTFP